MFHRYGFVNVYIHGGAISVYRYIIFFFSTKSSYNTYIETYIACVKRLKRLDISHLHSEVFDVDSTLWFIERKKMNVEILCPLFLMVFQEALTKCSAFHLGWTVLDTFFSVYILVIRIMRSDRRFLLCWSLLKYIKIDEILTFPQISRTINTKKIIIT